MKLGIYGTGGMGREVMQAAMESHQWEEAFFIVDREYLPQERMLEGHLIMCIDDIACRDDKDDIEILICVGEPKTRANLYQNVKKRSLKMATFVDPSVKLHACTRIGEGVIVLRGCIFASNVIIENNAALSFGVIIGHDGHIMENVYLAPRVCTGGFVTWKKNSFGGINCSIKEQVTIGQNAIVGQGAVVIKDVLDNTTVVGNPAKTLEKRAKHNVFN